VRSLFALMRAWFQAWECGTDCSTSGKTKEDEDVTGTISIPEVAHDTEEEEYVVRFSTGRAPPSHKTPRCHPH